MPQGVMRAGEARCWASRSQGVPEGSEPRTVEPCLPVPSSPPSCRRTRFRPGPAGPCLAAPTWPNRVLGSGPRGCAAELQGTRPTAAAAPPRAMHCSCLGFGLCQACPSASASLASASASLACASASLSGGSVRELFTGLALNPGILAYGHFAWLLLPCQVKPCHVSISARALFASSSASASSASPGAQPLLQASQHCRASCACRPLVTRPTLSPVTAESAPPQPPPVP